MKIEVTARHFDASDKIRDYAIEKVSKIRRYFNNPINCRVILSRENDEHIAEINLFIAGNQIFVKESSDNMFKSIDGAVDKLVVRVKKFKTKRYAHT